jgi:outer membrane immunogenic protein
MVKLIQTALLMSGLLSAFNVARAADLVEAPLPVIEPPFSWTGFYIGVHAGGTFGDNDAQIRINGVPYFVNGSDDPFKLSADGFEGGAQIGYNWQMDAFVFGIEADLGAMGASDATGGTGDPQYWNGLGTDYDWLATVRGRLGYAWDRTLIYGTAGLAISNFSDTYHFQETTVPDNFTDRSWSDTATGWTIGGGVEYAVTNNVFLRVEGLYVDLGSTTVDLSQNFPPDQADAEIDHAFGVARVGLNYRF